MTVEEITIDGQRYRLTPIPTTGATAEKRTNGETEMPVATVGGKRNKKQKKAKGTRKLSPYMRFAQNARKEILAKEPELKSDIIAVGRKIGEMWRGMSDAEKAKY
jgi:hypothetical protein